jgi:protein tyrosine/serine phosphatase
MKKPSAAQRFHLVCTYSKVLVFTFVLALVQGAVSAQAPRDPATGIDNYGKVSDRYYRGSQPESDQFAKLKDLGVKTIVDLRKDRVGEAAAWARDAGLHYINIPLTTKRAATDEQTTYFLSVVNDPANWPVYVHCKGGRHRTGEMTAIYRITQDGWTADQAYEEMKKYDFKDSVFYPRTLKKYVFSYYERFTSEKAVKAAAGNAAPATASPLPN